MATTENEIKGLVPRRPVAQLTGWDEELRRMFGEVFAGALCPSFDGQRRRPFSFGRSTPDIDLYEEKKEIIVKAELPGMEKDSIQIKFSDHQLSIKGEKKRDKGLKEENYYFSECSYGPFLRVLDLPSDAQVEKARTTFKNGILEIRLPKAEEIKRKTIKIKVE